MLIADIVRSLEEDIVFGVFYPKQKLTEDGLLTRFGVKRHVIREVLAQLNVMGLVERLPNRGAYVCELTPQEVIDIYDVREILEVAAAKHRHVRPDPAKGVGFMHEPGGQNARQGSPPQTVVRGHHTRRSARRWSPASPRSRP